MTAPQAPVPPSGRAGGGASGPAEPAARPLTGPENQPLSAAELSRLKWRTRRGLLENDLFIERFFCKYESQLTVRHANGLNALMSLADNDLLDLHLNRKSLADVDASIDSPQAREVLTMLKEKK